MASIKQLSHSQSTPQLSQRTSGSPSLSPHGTVRRDSDMLNTIPDPRASTPLSTSSRNGSTDSGHHPDLSDEVANLSAKLVNAINHQTSLDDTLQATQLELLQAREYIARLEAQAREQEERMQRMIEKALYEKMEAHLRSELTEEKKQRTLMEKEKKRIEAELENLTTALFEEANTMVAAARRETEASERRNEQLKNQMKDAENLLASQQEQLHDLKVVMEKMSSDHDDESAQVSTAPSTPGPTSADRMSRMFEANHLSPYSPGEHDIAPEPPLRFSHLIHPVLRNDLQAHKEFQELLKTTKVAISAPPSRVGSGNYGSLTVLGLGTYVNSPPHSGVSHHSNGSTASLPSATSIAATAGTTSPRPGSTLPPLKENVFYKRALAEDIEPTLRLDQAPGISWIARRTVLNSMTNGALVIEPHPPIKKHRGPVFACAMCGENRIGDAYCRRFRFRISENEEAQRYPLCDYCLNRMRTACDYIGFLRMVRDGHWRADTEEDVKSAWEESVRLREKMFWSRVGGGVVPAFVQSPKIAGPGKDGESEHSIVSPLSDDEARNDPFQSKPQDKAIVSPIEPPDDEPSPVDVSPLTPESQHEQNEIVSAHLQNEAGIMLKVEISDNQGTFTPQPSPKIGPHDKKDVALSVSVPGSFD